MSNNLTMFGLQIIFILSMVCLYGSTATSPCGPMEFCSCIRDGMSGFVKMDCSNRSIPLRDACNYTKTHDTITEVVFNSNNVSVLQAIYLIGCEHVKELYLRNSSILHVEQGTFTQMKRLTLLDLSWNKLDIYSKYYGYLNNLASLRELRLQGNFKGDGISNVSYPYLSNLPDLDTLLLDGLYNTEFHDNYVTLHKLSHLGLSGSDGVCNMGELTNLTFLSLPHLNKLDISYCNVTNIQAGAFAMLHRLTWLDLSLNQQLGFNPLRNISYSLQFTQIDFLNISKLHNTFGLGTEVKRRDLCYMRNTTLRVLVLDSNRIQLFETNLALLLPSTLQIIHTKNNKFTFGLFLLQLACLSNVLAFDVGFQNFAHAPLDYLDDPVNKTSVKSQDNGNCFYDDPSYLKNLSESISGCHYFESEKLTKTDLYRASFPPDVKAASLHDSGMNFRIIQYTMIPFYNHVESVDVSGNILYSWIGPIGPFPHLKSLNISRNYCSHVGPSMFMLMGSLQLLYIGQNFLGISLADDNRGDIFKPLTNLKVLDISSNQIRDLPSSVFVHLTSLQMLNLSFNSINQWTMDVKTLPDLCYLDIRSNALSELPQYLTSHFDTLSSQKKKDFTIDMKHNPIQCSCKYERFLRWMVQHQTSFVGFLSYNFTDESGNRLTASGCINKVEHFSKACRSFTLLIVLCSIGVTLFISFIICGLIYKNRWTLRYILYMNKRRFFGYRAVPDYEPIENYRYDAFISYAEENTRFILEGIIPSLEKKGLNLCIHQRDFIAGNAVTDNIINAIQSSRKTVILLSKAFLKSKWCLYEFHMSRMEIIYSRDGNSSLIVVMLENTPPDKLMPLEMIEWIKRKSYIEYTDDEPGNTLFWDKLKEGIMQ